MLRINNQGSGPAPPEQQLRQAHTPILELLNQQDSLDIRFIQAEQYFNEHNFYKSYEILKKIKDEDPYFVEAIPLLCSVLIELNKQGELYHIAHMLVEANPDSAVSWYAVGSYYYLVRKFPQARKYFQKATQMDKNFSASWIAFGHCYSAQDESEQAIAAYRSASRLFPGCHLADLFIGMELLKMNNLQLAIHHFELAKNICQTDPLIFNEIGATYYKQGQYAQA